MSQENVELVRRGFEVINRNELPAVLEFVDGVADPDFELRAFGRLPDVSTVRGSEAVKDWFAQLLETFEWRQEVDEIIDAGDAVVVVVRYITRGRASGVETSGRMTYIFGFRHGKATYFDTYRIRQEALEAVGLRE
jgi:ketosteroid isomerase-like protein